MTKKSRMLFVGAIILLLLIYFFPIWKIGLSAPQYPEGIGLYIWVNKITGQNKFDMDNINRLNHYIGMKEIIPDEISELQKIPYLIALLILIGLVGILTNKRLFFVIWLIFFLLMAVVGMVDFYKWEYDYGHNLHPDAPIKVPGMTYQPPLIGTKKLLNITSKSYPAIGGWFAILSLSIGFIIFFFEFKRFKIKPISTLKNGGLLNLELVIFTLIFLRGCSVGPSPIEYGQDMCVLCQMIISDPRFGTEMVSTKGKVNKYDSVECLVQDYLKGSLKSEQIHSIWVTDFSKNTKFIPASSATYLQSQNLRSPMGMGLSAYSDKENARQMQLRSGGNLLQWDELLQVMGNTESGQKFSHQVNSQEKEKISFSNE